MSCGHPEYAAQELLRVSTRAAFLSTPSLYFSLPKVVKRMIALQALLNILYAVSGTLTSSCVLTIEPGPWSCVWHTTCLAAANASWSLPSLCQFQAVPR